MNEILRMMEKILAVLESLNNRVVKLEIAALPVPTPPEPEPPKPNTTCENCGHALVSEREITRGTCVGCSGD